MPHERLRRQTRVNADLQVVTVGCSDDLCSPSWAARRFLINRGIIAEIPESNIHPVRNAGGVFTGEVMWGEGTEARIVYEHMLKQIGFLVEKKGATYVFITGHNPCAGCGTIDVDVEMQKRRLVEVAQEVVGRFKVQTIVMIEEHGGDQHYDVLEIFESIGMVVNAA